MAVPMHVAVVVLVGCAALPVRAQVPAPNPALIDTTPTAYFTQLGETVRSQLPAGATPKERADRVFAVMDSLARKGHRYPVNKSLLGRAQGLLSSTEAGTCGWWTARMREAFTAAGIPKASIVVLESHAKDPTVSGGAVSDTLVDTAHNLANVNNVHQSVAILDGESVRTYDVWQDGADLDRQSSSTVNVGAISYGPEKGRIASEWFARQAKEGRPLLTQDGFPLPKSLLVLKNRNAALEAMKKAGAPTLAEGVKQQQLEEWFEAQSLLDLMQQGRLDPESLVKRLGKSRLAASKPAAAPAPSSSSGCWEKASGPSEVPFVEPPGRGYSGSGSASAGSVSLRTHPADPKWSHLVKGGFFTWSFGGSRPASLCPGEVLSGHATFSNNGTELVRSGYSPSASLRVELGATNKGAAQLFQLSSADLPAPGQTVARPFRYSIQAGSTTVSELRIVAEVYAGRVARFTEVYRWTPR